MGNDGELRATSDLMLEMLDRLRGAEEVKRARAPGTPEFADLAYRVVELSRTLTAWAELQLRLANEALAADEPSPEPLESVRPRRLDEVLAEWRRAEIRLSHASPASPEALTAAEEAEDLRREYGRLQERKLADRAE